MAAIGRSAAADEHGIDAIDAYDSAFYRNAFADHFLQDSHAAGHMGFNRSASSIAATTAYHGVWNARGRLVESRDGALTYGDGLLKHAKNSEGRERVIQACANSAYSVVAAFVFGRRDADHELAAWRELPYLIDATPVDASEPHLAARLEVRRPLGLSVDGLLSHQVGAAFLWEARTSELVGWTSAFYVIQLELGVTLISLQIGPTLELGADAFGYQSGLSLGRVFGVAGGGVR